MRPGVLMLVLVAGAAHAALPARFEPLDSEASPSHRSVYALAQDRDGFLWLGTQDGLNRYDGYEFRVWRNDPTDVRSLSANRVNALFEDSRRRLWVGTTAGADRFDRAAGQFERGRRAASGGPLPTVFRFAESDDGTVWSATDAGLYRYDESAAAWRLERLSEGVPPRAVWYLAVDPEGELWALEPDERWLGPAMQALHPPGAESVEAGTLEPPLLWRVGPGGPKRGYRLAGRWGDFAFDAAGRLWMSASGPADLDERRRVARTPGKHAMPRPASDGGLWIQSGNGRLYRAKPGDEAATPVGRTGGSYLERSPRDLLEDRTGIVWMATLAGLFRWDPNARPFEHLGPQQGLHDAPVSALLEDSAGRIWIGTYGSGLCRSTERALECPPEDLGLLPDQTVWALEEHAGEVWAGTSRHICALGDTEPRCRLVPGASTIQALHSGPGNDLWIGADAGLRRFDPEADRLEELPVPGRDGSEALVVQMLEEPGGLWLATWAGALKRFDLDRREYAFFPRLHDNGWLATNSIFDLAADPGGAAGVLWLGTGDGLTRFDTERGVLRTYTVEDGLPGSSAYSILSDGRGRLWIGTNRGLTRFDPGAETFRTYGRGDGVLNVELNRNARLRLRDGTFLFGGMDGITRFRPREVIDSDAPPPVALTALRVLSREGARPVPTFGLDRLALSHREDTFELEFAALSFAQPAANRYRYRLEGLDDDWVEAGSRRFARYVHVPPGDYLLRVQGSNHDLVWNREGVALPIRIRPPSWETWWFRLLMAVVGVGAVYGLYRYRLSRLLAIERLRLRIAGDLHDQLSSDLSGIAIASDAMSEEGSVNGEVRQGLRRVRDTALESLEGLRDIVWYVNPELDTLEALESRMRNTAGQLLPGTDCRWRFEVPEMAVPMAFRRQVYLAYKEMLHNVVRHARADEVEVELVVRDGRLELAVADDGVGFDPGAAGEGTGLASLGRRAERLGGRLEIDSAAGAGTRIALSAPMPKCTKTGDGAAVAGRSILGR